MLRYKSIAVAVAVVIAAPSLAHASSVRISPDESTSKDAFVYAFEIPGTLGIPGSPNMLNFDTENIPATAAVPFGATLGVAETIPFRNNPLIPMNPSANTPPVPSWNSTSAA